MTRYRWKPSGRVISKQTRAYVFWRPSAAFLPAAVWGRLRGHTLGVLQYEPCAPWVNWVFCQLGVQRINAGDFATDLSVESPWVAMRDPLLHTVQKADQYAFLQDLSSIESSLFRAKICQELADGLMCVLIAVDWARDKQCTSVHCFSQSLLDTLPSDQELAVGASIDVQISAYLGSAAKVVERVAAHLVSACQALMQNLSCLRRPNKEDLGEPESGSVSSPKESSILVVANHGLTFSNLYSYDFLLSADPDSPRFAQNVAYLAARRKTLENGESAIGLTELYSVPGRLKALSTLLFRTRLGRIKWCQLPVLIRYFRFFALSIEFEDNMRKCFPQARMAILLYNIRVPFELLCALHNLHIRTISNHERPQVGLVPYLPIVADTLLVESNYFAQELQESHFASVGELLPVGMWRTDTILKDRKEANLPKRPIALILPLALPGVEDRVVRPSEMTSDGFRHFMSDMLALAEINLDVDFVIRTKNLTWVSDKRLKDLTREISRSRNVVIGTSYERPLEAHRICAQANVVIAKYTSMVDEALACGIPAIVHDYTHNRHPGACISSRHIPESFFVHSFEELRERFTDFMAADRQENFDALRAVRNDIYGGLADGNVMSRIHKALDGMYAASNRNNHRTDSI